MGIYICRRLAYIVVILFVMSILVFGLTQILPADVARMVAGQFASDDVVAAVRTRLGLDAPLHVQYWNWISGVLSGDMGTSLVMDRPVNALIGEALLRSSSLALVSIVLVAVFGIVLGVAAALRHNGPLDHGVSIFTYVGISAPEFFWGIVLILVFAGMLGWFPSGGYAPLADGVGPWAAHIVLPAATLTFTLIAHVSRLTRSSMLETMQSNYVRFARAKGMSENIVVRRHALRNALLPTITILAIDVGWLMGGIVVVETVFSFHGIGRTLMFAIERRDLPLIQAGILVIAAIYTFANLAADLLYAYFNPRIRYG